MSSNTNLGSNFLRTCCGESQHILFLYAAALMIRSILLPEFGLSNFSFDDFYNDHGL